VQGVTQSGIWTWNARTDEAACSEQSYPIPELSPSGKLPSRSAFLTCIHSDDRPAFEAALENAVKTTTPQLVDACILREDGTLRFVQGICERVEYLPENQIFIRLILQDITALRTAEIARNRSERRLAGILALSSEAILAVNDAGIIRMFNKGAERIFGHEADAVIGQPLDMLLPERVRAAHGGMIAAFAKGGEESRQMSQRGRIVGLRRDGTEFPGQASIAKIDLHGETIFTVILRDITEQIRTENALIAAKELAEASDQAKSDFLGNMSHELRTPLNAIIGFSEMMTTAPFGPLGDERYENYVTDILNSGHHLLRIINEILDVAKIEAGVMSMDESIIDLQRVAQESIRLVKSQAHCANISLEVSLPKTFLRVRADEQRIKQVMINLLANAVKFTPRGGHVTIAGALDAQGGIEIRVIDTGIGIPQEWLGRLGRPFVQVEGRLSRKHVGTGLGLAFSKSVIELHGGTMTIESGVGQGTTVRIRLPAERVFTALEVNLRNATAYEPNANRATGDASN